MDNLAVSAASNAASLFNSPAERAKQSLRLADASVRTQASRAAAQAGAGAISTTQLNYTVGPDGQLYATSAVISTSQRTRGADDTALPNGQNLPPAQPLSLADIQPTRAGLTPSDEAIVFGSPEFQETPRLQLAA